uniref:Galaxin n=1 Tax=Phallusia mammillata TaxID=59560 RepID=A0A6F9DWJ3_9ASCI|nr:galaxin [Phallusia mammillata]
MIFDKPLRAYKGNGEQTVVIQSHKLSGGRVSKEKMKNILFSLAVSVVVLATVGSSSAARCKRGIQICNVTDDVTGQFTLTEYNGCVQMCCGGKLYDRDAYFQCCGNNERGIPYNDNTQMCCMWQYGNEYVIHNKTQGAWCCGSELFDPAESPGQSCCNSWTNKPAIFSSTTEMCCEGQVGFSGDTAYTSCCGAISYDRRIASCPCHDGQVQIGASELTAACCQNSDGTKAPINTETEGCCNGLVYDNSLQFCCNGLVGEVGTEVCCGDSIASKSANQTGSSCCLLNDGSTVVYDPTQQLCCGGALVDNLGNDAAGQICCNGNVFDTETAGDACCNDVPYFSSDSTCCSGEIQPSVYIYHSCCVNATPLTPTCKHAAGGIVYDNPEIISTITGEIEVSHQTGCCGDFSNDQHCYLTITPQAHAATETSSI